MPHALACLALIAILATVSVSAAAAERCAEIVGRIAAAEPRVEIVLGPDRRALSPGEPLCAGDILTSGDAERAVVVLEGGATIQLAPGSTVTIGGRAKEGRTVIRLLRGVIRLFGRRQPLEVDTPFADAAVEGTEFAVALEPDRTRVAVLEGRVRVSNPKGALRVDAGQAAVAVAGRAPELELRIRPRDAVRWALYYPPIGEARLPPNTSAAVREAARLEAEGRRAEALARLDSVPPNARDATYQTLRAELLLGTGRPEEAEAALAEALRQRPDDADALALRSVVAVAANDKDRALADARRAVELAPKSTRARLALSYAAQASFDIPLARKSLEAAVKAAPDDALAWARLAETQLMEGNVRAATRSAAKAVALDPQSARAHTVHGFVALARIDTRQAKADFARALELQSFNPLARLGLGLATIRDGKLAAGREQIELAVALGPDDALLRSYLGKAYLEERRDGLAGEELETAKALDPNDPTPWLYDAITKQRENQPVKALQDFEAAIARNDDRAVYRSRLLLDQDRASLAAGVAQIYNDLGFEILGAREGATSLARDPSSYSAHRFLADNYELLQRHEIARGSELLQSELLQPLGAPAIAPSEAFQRRRTTVVTSQLAGTTVDESSRLFERDGFRGSLSGLAGTDDTYGAEGVVSAQSGRVALSAGQLHSQSNGFLDNQNFDTDGTRIFAQVQPNPEIGLQAEYRRLQDRRGDTALHLEPLEPFSGKTSERDESMRIGGALRLAPGLNAIAYLAQNRRIVQFDESSGETSSQFDIAGPQGEAQILWTGSLGHSVFGIGMYSVDESIDDRTVAPSGPNISHAQFDRKSSYFYQTVDILRKIDLTFGLSVGYNNDTANRIAGFDVYPKLGVAWHPLTWLTLRAAAFKVRIPAITADQTVEPTQIAGFDQFLDDPTDTQSTQYALGADIALGPSIWAGASIRHLNLDLRTIRGDADVVSDDADEDLYQGYLGWTLSPRLAVFLSAELDDYRSTISDDISRLRTWYVPLTIRYFDPSGFSLRAGASLVSQRATIDGQQNENTFPIVDFGASYRFAAGRAEVSADLFNSFDQSVHYQDDNFRFYNAVPAPFSPQRLAVLRFTLRF